MTVDAAADLDGSGWLALHYAVAYGAPRPLVERLLLAHPDGARARVGTGPLARLPLQLALARQADADTIRRLLQAYPEAVNAAGRGTPSVLLAAVHRRDAALVRVLLEAEADPKRAGERAAPPQLRDGGGAARAEQQGAAVLAVGGRGGRVWSRCERAELAEICDTAAGARARARAGAGRAEPEPEPEPA